MNKQNRCTMEDDSAIKRNEVVIDSCTTWMTLEMYTFNGHGTIKLFKKNLNIHFQGLLKWSTTVLLYSIFELDLEGNRKLHCNWY